MLHTSKEWFKTSNYFHKYAIGVKINFFKILLTYMQMENKQTNKTTQKISLPSTSYSSSASWMDVQMKNVYVFHLFVV